MYIQKRIWCISGVTDIVNARTAPFAEYYNSLLTFPLPKKYFPYFGSLASRVSREYDACDVRLYVIPATKTDRALKKLEDNGYDSGPDPSAEFSLREGDRLEVAFRGNVKCVDENPQLNAVFTTNLDTSVALYVEQHDVFVQKAYNVYRGFVQLRKVTKTLLAPGATAAADKKPGGPAVGAPPPSGAAPAPPAAAPPAAASAPAAAPAEGTAAETPAAPTQEAEAGAGGDAAAAAAAAVAEVPAVEEPPPPMFEIKVTLVSELLITFPKVGSVSGYYSLICHVVNLTHSCLQPSKAPPTLMINHKII